MPQISTTKILLFSIRELLGNGEHNNYVPTKWWLLWASPVHFADECHREKGYTEQNWGIFALKLKKIDRVEWIVVETVHDSIPQRDNGVN